MLKFLLTFLLLACLAGCAYVLHHTNLAEGLLGDNFAGNADIVARELSYAMVGSHYTGIVIVATCIVGIALRWCRWQGPSRGIWLVALVTLVLGIFLIMDSVTLIKVFREIGTESFSKATLIPVKIGNWLWYEDAGLEGGVAAVPHYVVFLFGHKALASGISLGLLLIGNLILGRPRSNSAEPQMP